MHQRTRPLTCRVTPQVERLQEEVKQVEAETKRLEKILARAEEIKKERNKVRATERRVEDPPVTGMKRCAVFDRPGARGSGRAGEQEAAFGVLLPRRPQHGGGNAQENGRSLPCSGTRPLTARSLL
jgi:hypothetical protein